MSTEETNPPAVVLSTAQLGAAPLFVVVRDMNYTGEILHGKWDGTRYYVLDDGDCYTPERLSDEYDAEFFDAEPNAVVSGA